MKDHLQRELIDIFGERVSFVAPLPPRGSGKLDAGPRPEAVARPTEADEVRRLVQFARKYGVPLVPRAAGTSHYGGADPVPGGVVVDFTLMKKFLSLRPDDLEVAVEPGITWQALEWQLLRQGHTLRVYPYSGATSTVGGWVASGGVGIGSYEFGTIRQNVSWVQLVLPSGEQVQLSRENLDLVVGTQGIAGLIVAVGLPVRRLVAENTIVLATFRRVADFLQAAVAMRQQRLPLWHVSFVSAAVDRDEVGLQVPLSTGDALDFPLTRHTAVFAFPNVSDAALKIRAQILTNFGVIKPSALGTTFWDDRWQQAGLGALGPATANGAVFLPTLRLESIYREARRWRWPIRFVSNLAASGWTSLRCLPTEGDTLPEDLVRDWLQVARRMGARPYGVDPGDVTGAEDYLAPDLYEWLLAFKHRQDPQRLINPGKLLPAEARGAERHAGATMDKLLRALQPDQPGAGPA